jgi:hypothetical protein
MGRVLHELVQHALNFTGVAQQHTPVAMLQPAQLIHGHAYPPRQLRSRQIEPVTGADDMHAITGDIEGPQIEIQIVHRAHDLLPATSAPLASCDHQQRELHVMTFYRTSGSAGTRALLGRALPTVGNRAFTAPTRSAPTASLQSRQAPGAPGAPASRFARDLSGGQQQRFAGGFGQREKFAVVDTDDAGSPVVELDPGETVSIGQNPDNGNVTINFVPAPEEEVGPAAA